MIISSFLSGVYMATFAASGLLFLKFYRASGDKLFSCFSLACWLLAAERIVLLFLNDPFRPSPSPQTELQSYVYFIRLVAFLIILYAIIAKNRKASS